MIIDITAFIVDKANKKEVARLEKRAKEIIKIETDSRGTEAKAKNDIEDTALNFNPNHDKLGRFGKGSGLDSGSISSAGSYGNPEENKKLTGILSTMAGFWAGNVQTNKLKYTSSEDMVLKEGRNFNPSPKPADVKQGAIKGCYENASLLALGNSNYTYVEGYALMSHNIDLPIAHAWVVDKGGNVIDNTWPDMGRAYMGIPLTSPFLLNALEKSKLYGLLSGSDINVYLKDGLPKGAIAELPEANSVANYSPTQARDKLGQFSTGGGGGSLGTIRGTAKHPRVVGTVDEAIKAILDGEDVEMKSAKQVHTVLSKLAAMAVDAKAKGKDAPNYDLCKVSVKGTNMFCASKLKTKENPNGIPRIKMPQIGGVPRPGSKAESFSRNPWDKSEVDGSQAFIDHLKTLGIKTTLSKRAVASLSASQAELVGPKVAKMMVDKKFDVTKNPIFISRDSYIIDGHHRWAASVGRDAEDGKLGNTFMPVNIVDAPISVVLKLANAWASDVGLQAASGKQKNDLDGKTENFNPNHDKLGQFSTGGGSGANAASEKRQKFTEYYKTVAKQYPDDVIDFLNAVPDRLWHATTEANAAKIEKEGYKPDIGGLSKGMTDIKGTWFFTSHEDAWRFAETNSSFGKDGGVVTSAHTSADLYKFDPNMNMPDRVSKKALAEIKSTGYQGIKGTEVFVSRHVVMPMKREVVVIFDPTTLFTDTEMRKIYYEVNPEAANGLADKVENLNPNPAHDKLGRFASGKVNGRASLTKEERAKKVARYKEIATEIGTYFEIQQKNGGLSDSEAKQYEKINKEQSDLYFELYKPLTKDRVRTLKESLSTLSADVVVIASNEKMSNRAAFDAIEQARAGVYYNRDTPIDNVMNGKNKKITPKEFYGTFKGTRVALKKQYGDKVPLYRAVGTQKDKYTTNWATTKEFVKQFGDNIVQKDIPVENIIAVNVFNRGGYHEIIVGQPPVIDNIKNSVETEKNFNPNHDKLGRFSGNGTISSLTQETTKKALFKNNGFPDVTAPNVKDFMAPYTLGFPGGDTLYAIDTWVDMAGCKQTQAYLRAPAFTQKEHQESSIGKTVKKLKELTNLNSLKSDVNLYRGMQMTQKELIELHSKKQFKTETFFTTALNGKRVETNFSNGEVWGKPAASTGKESVLFRIKAPAGTKGYFTDTRWPSKEYYSNFGEFMPSLDNNYKIDNVKIVTDGNKQFAGGIVDLEVSNV